MRNTHIEKDKIDYSDLPQSPLEVVCPRCKAESNNPCKSLMTGKEEFSPHSERIAVVKRLHQLRSWGYGIP